MGQVCPPWGGVGAIPTPPAVAQSSLLEHQEAGPVTDRITRPPVVPVSSGPPLSSALTPGRRGLLHAPLGPSPASLIPLCLRTLAHVCSECQERSRAGRGSSPCSSVDSSCDWARCAELGHRSEAVANSAPISPSLRERVTSGISWGHGSRAVVQ